MNSISPEELLARYIFDSNCVRLDGTVRYKAFLPAPNNKTSVFRTSGLDESAIWGIGQSVASKRTQILKGRADIEALHIFKQGLRIEPSTITHPLHADIIWPDERSKQKLIAVELAAKAHFVSHSTSV